MKSNVRLLALGAVAAVGALSLASASSAADLTTFAQYTQSSAAPTLQWTQSASHTGGTFTTIGTPVVNFSFLTIPVFQQANFNFTGVVASGTPAAVTGVSEFQQDGLNGTFSFTSANAFAYNGANYAAGTNLLSAGFTKASINSTGTSGSASDSTFLAGRSITYTSALIDTSIFTDKDFSFTLTGARPAITAAAGSSLSNFTASSTGSFSRLVAGVPEPSAWALMLIGFGGAGVMLRRAPRRAQAAVA